MLKLVFLLKIILVVNIMANFSFIGDIVKHVKFSDHVQFQCSNALFNLYVVDSDIIRFRFTNRDEFSKAPSYAVINNNFNSKYEFQEKNDYFQITTEDFIIEISKSPCRVSIYDSQMNLINSDEKSFGVSFDNDEVRCHKTLFEDELFYGLGEKTGNLQKNGNQYTLWNSDVPGYDNNDDAIYQSIPFFIGIRDHKAYGIFFDNTYKSYFNFGASNNRFYWFGAEKGELNYYFIGGPEIKKVISSYTELTGKMELPPMWALGYQQCKWSYYPESKVRNVAKTFRDKDIPCDVIYLDIHYMDEYRVFTWDDEKFPNPEMMLADLKKDGFKVITIVDPGVKADLDGYKPAIEGMEQNLFAIYPDGEPYQGEVWPSWAYFPDFTKKETRAWWGDWNAKLLKQGISGIWNDMNEPAVWGKAFPDIVQFNDNGFGASHKKIHNVYALEMAKATFEGLKKSDNDLRPFILTRAGYSGIQRYAAVWTGDNVASEEHLQLACTMPLNMGLSGIPFVGSDVGGFFSEPSPNLYTRWIQMSALSPFFRGHTIINTKDQEPWAFGDYIESLAREAIKLRYKLMPYIYNEFYNSSINGLPIMQPMMLEFQDDEECYKTESQYQYMFGQNLLVAPVLKENTEFKKLYLPKGKWIGFDGDKIYDGGQWVIIDAPLNKLPLFIKEGGIIPMIESQNYIGEKKIKTMEFKIFPSDNSEYTLYEDDGISQDHNKEKFSKTKFKVSKNSDKFEIMITKVVNNFNSGIEEYQINLMSMKSVSKVKVNDVLLEESKEKNKTIKKNSFYYNITRKILFLNIDNQDKLKIIGEFK